MKYLVAFCSAVFILSWSMLLATARLEGFLDFVVGIQVANIDEVKWSWFLFWSGAYLIFGICGIGAYAHLPQDPNERRLN